MSDKYTNLQDYIGCKNLKSNESIWIILINNKIQVFSNYKGTRYTWKTYNMAKAFLRRRFTNRNKLFDYEGYMKENNIKIIDIKSLLENAKC